eukprot:GFUD01025112.1.p1 GENE.GFUD01025112.1~~GFUD01025112.1.p1  ORF type:complete len:234 (+),score=98.60 GFUD01025112.1:178-879(+)
MSGRVVVYGGRGALGSAIVTKFKESGWWVANVDMKISEGADENILVEGETWVQQEENVTRSVGTALGGEKLDVIICMAGGWAGGSPASKDFVKNSDLMWRASVWPASISASLAARHLKEGGMVVLPGAAPAVGGTPGMAGYGMAKAAVHQLTKSLACQGSGLPDNCLAAALLPVTLDTPMNRKWMAKADQTTWTPLEFVSSLLLQWAVGEDRPESGSLVKLVTEGGNTSLVCT